MPQGLISHSHASLEEHASPVGPVLYLLVPHGCLTDPWKSRETPKSMSSQTEVSSRFLLKTMRV